MNTGQIVDPDAFQEEMRQVAHDAAHIRAEGEGVPADHPENRPDHVRGEAQPDGVQEVLRSRHSAVEQGKPHRRHEHHQGRCNDHPRRVAGIQGGFLPGGHVRGHQQKEDDETEYDSFVLHFNDLHLIWHLCPVLWSVFDRPPRWEARRPFRPLSSRWMRAPGSPPQPCPPCRQPRRSPP